MQLFICPNLHLQGQLLTIKNHPELVRQLRKVLRAKPGYRFLVQHLNTNTRYQVRLQDRTDTQVTVTLEATLTPPLELRKTAMAIALPNKREKLELIVQKLTEIGITTIYLRAAERSVLKTLPPQKYDRLQKIMLEALEQSYGWQLPQLQMLTDWQQIAQEYQLRVFDLPESNTPPASCMHKHQKSDLPPLGIIGPEGGLTNRDYALWQGSMQRFALGTSVLRMETAAIIGAWSLHNDASASYECFIG